MISTIKLRRFKKFQNNEIQFAPFTVLMGENNCGKTTVLQAINLSLNTFSKSDLITEKSGIHLAKSRGIGATTLPGINISDFRELYYAKISRLNKSSEKNFGAIIEIKDDKNNVYILQVSSLFGGFNLKCLSEKKHLQNSPELYKYIPLLISGFVGLEEAEQRSFPANIRQHLSSGNVSSIIRNLVLDLKKNNLENYHKLENRLKKDFDFSLDDIKFNEQKDMFVKAAYSETLDQREISLGFNSSGSGYMQILQIFAPIYTLCPNECKIVLLDEPDAHLHPNMQIALAKSLQNIQKELNIQIIISTHSSAIIKSVPPNSVVPIAANYECCKPLSESDEVEENIAQLDNYELAKSSISGKIVFIEDKNIDIWETIDRIVGTHIFVGVNTVSVHTGRSKDDKMPFLIKPVLEKFLDKDIEVVFVRDSDGISSEWRERLYKYSSERNVSLCLLEKYEVENYLLDAPLVYKALKKKYPDKEIPSIEDISTRIFNFLKNTIIMSRYKYDDNLEDCIFKTALLLNLQEYRGHPVVKSEAEKIRGSYEAQNDYALYQRNGMGKEALKQLFDWLNDEIKLNLNKGDILGSMELEDIPEELIIILNQMKAKARKQENDVFQENTEITFNEGNQEDDSVQSIMQLTMPIKVMETNQR